jgi:hypothetical protein
MEKNLFFLRTGLTAPDKTPQFYLWFLRIQATFGFNKKSYHV